MNNLLVRGVCGMDYLIDVCCGDARLVQARVDLAGSGPGQGPSFEPAQPPVHQTLVPHEWRTRVI